MKKKLQLFISSTFTDLKKERQAAVEAILKSGNIPAGMELFTAGNQSQLNTIKRWIDESDIFLLVLGARYGSIEPISQKSYIEVEFDYAVSKNKPLFSIVIDEECLRKIRSKTKRSDTEFDDQQKYHKFREKVLSNISSFFKSPKDIKLAIHETLRDFNARYQFSGWVPGEAIARLNELEDKNVKLIKEVEELSKSEEGNSAAESDEKTKIEIEFIQKMIEEARLEFQKFSFETKYYANQNTLLSEKDKIFVDNKNGDAIRKFFYYTQRILLNCINSYGFHPLSDNAFYNVFPNGAITSVEAIKRLINSSISTIDFILNSNKGILKDRLVVYSIDRLHTVIADNILKHETILHSIISDLFPKMIERCVEKKNGAVPILTEFYEGLSEIYKMLNDLKERTELISLKKGLIGALI